jgi:PTS system galactitol-specific IIC component
MHQIKDIIMYFLSFKAYVMLPFIIFTLAIVFRIKLADALRSALTIGIGFIGIFVIFDYFVKIIHPVVKALINRAGLHFNVLDVGWPPLAAITWSFKLAPFLLLLVMVLNIVLLALKLTKTVNIDIWNYWHFIFTGSLVYNISKSFLLSIVATLVIAALTLKLADWSAPLVNKFSGMDGISIPTLSSVAYFPLGVLGDKIIDNIPILNKIDANPEKMQKKLGLLGEPPFIGLILGILLGIGAGYGFKDVLDVSFSIAAVIYILPKMCNIVGTSLIPISEGMKTFIERKLPNMGKTYIALDVAVLVGNPSVVITSVLLMPFALLLAFILPGVKFIPLGDLTSIMGTMALVCVATKGNVIRSFFVGLIIIIGNLYTSSGMAVLYTKLSHVVNYKVSDYNGVFTSFLDGGNFLRVWTIKLFTGNLYAILLIPIVAIILFLTRKYSEKESL